MRQLSESDFGITGLVDRIPSGWYSHEGPLDILDLGMPGEPAAVLALRQDAVLLRDGLDAAEIEELWRYSAPVSFRLAKGSEGSCGTRWMQLIVERCDRWMHHHDVQAVAAPEPRLGAAVLAEIAELAPGDEARPVLVRCVRRCSPDLAFRFLLKMLACCWSDVPAAQYDRFVLLGQEFGYPEWVVVAAEKLVSERQPIEFTPFDFGITALYEQIYADEHHQGPPMDKAEMFLREDAFAAEALALRNDARLLRDGLSPAEIEILFHASGGGFRFGDLSGIPSGIRWMELILDRYDRRPADRNRSPVAPPGPGHQHADAILAEVLEVLPADDVRDAVARCVRACSPDLAFRFLLRVLDQRRPELSREQYRRYIKLGEEFGYGEFLVSTVEYLVLRVLGRRG